MITRRQDAFLAAFPEDAHDQARKTLYFQSLALHDACEDLGLAIRRALGLDRFLQRGDKASRPRSSRR